MIDIYVRDMNLNLVGIVDSYSSLIWASRYNETGDCEIYIDASEHYLNLLKKGYFITRNDDDMVCQIKKIQLQTDAETGNHLIVTGYDAKEMLGQRIIWEQMVFDGTVEDAIRQMVTENIINPSIPKRKMTLMKLGAAKGFTESLTVQYAYENVGEKIRELCKTNNYGYKVTIGDDENELYFELYKGVDRTSSQTLQPQVVFSADYENLISTDYQEDSTKAGNVMFITGEGEGNLKETAYIGDASDINRYEVYVNASEVSKNLSYDSLVELYPEGKILTQGAKVYWLMQSVDLLVLSDDQLNDLKKEFPGGETIEKDRNRYYRAKNAKVAIIGAEDSEAECQLLSVVYNTLLLQKGVEANAEYGSVKTFEGGVDPTTSFIYKNDYFMGDVVTVRNEYGIEADARITEVIETCNENGTTIEPKFEYMEVL